MSWPRWVQNFSGWDGHWLHCETDQWSESCDVKEQLVIWGKRGTLPLSGCYSQYGSKGPAEARALRRCSPWSQLDDGKLRTTSSSRDEWRVGLMNGGEEVLWPGLAEGLVIDRVEEKKKPLRSSNCLQLVIVWCSVPGPVLESSRRRLSWWLGRGLANLFVSFTSCFVCQNVSLPSLNFGKEIKTALATSSKNGYRASDVVTVSVKECQQGYTMSSGWERCPEYLNLIRL